MINLCITLLYHKLYSNFAVLAEAICIRSFVLRGGYPQKVFVIILVMILQTVGYAQSSTSLSIIPKPAHTKMINGAFRLSANTKLYYVGNDAERKMCALVAASVQNTMGISLAIEQASKNGNRPANGITLRMRPNLKILKEGYTLSIHPHDILIQASDAAGLFYGVQSLLQLLPPGSFDNTNTPKQASIPCADIRDAPRFGWRGMHLDVARHFFDKNFIKKYIDLLAMCKLNVFHWHLTDDQGWRIEIKKYPRLTEMGAWREDRRQEPWSYFQYGVDPAKPVYGGYYTQDDIREIVEYARARYITVLPEIDLPGHSWAAIYAYNWLSCDNKVWKKPDNSAWEFSDPLCICRNEVVEFTKDVLSEIIDLFPSPYIHIGGDECKHEVWAKQKECKEIMEKEGLISTKELQGRFNRQIEKFITSKGRKMIGWDEILEGGIGPEAAVMSWRGFAGGIEAAQHQHPFVMASSSHLYFDMNQSDGEPEKEGLQLLPLEKVYSLEPVPAELSMAEAKYLLGVEACLWTELVQTPQKVESQLLPRALALSEVAWTPPQIKNYADFKKRVEAFYPYLDQKGYQYFIPAPTGLRKNNVVYDPQIVNLQVDNARYSIRYTINDTEPTLASAIYKQPLTVTGPCTIRTKTFLSNGKSSATNVGYFTKMEPLRGINLLVAPSSGISYTYYVGKTTSVHSWDQLTKIGTGTLTGFNFPKEAIKDTFALEYHGIIQIPTTGIYTFYAASDDGSALWIGDRLVVDNDGSHSFIEKNGQVVLEAGWHMIKVRYFEALYGENLRISYEGPGIKKNLLTVPHLFR